MIYNIDDAINNIFGIQEIQPRNLIDDINNAHNLVYDVIRGNGRRIAIVQGPPGTGKTTVYELVIEDVIRNNTIDRNEMLVYIAPTNQLAFDMFKRILYIYKALGFNKKDVSNIRIYGSKFRYNDFDICGSAIDENARIVITTQYQRVYSNRVYHLLIDEASKTLLHQPFIPITSRLRGREDDILVSLSVIGDPKQAIALDQNYRSERGRRFLIMENFIHGLLTENGIKYTQDDDITQLALRHLKDNFSFLDITKRLPKPSETPISHGYYNGLLRGYYEAREVLRGYDLNNNRGRELCSTVERFKNVINAIEDAITTNRPIIYARTKSFDVRDSLLFDSKRSLIALDFVIALTVMSGKSTTIIAPYTDQIMITKMLYRSAYVNFLMDYEKNKIRFATVHSTIGTEDYNIIAVLGKEYTFRDNPTIYYQEPELFNVQLSRHKGILVVIGDLVRLKNKASEQDRNEQTTRYKPISITSAKLLELTGYKPNSYSNSGDGAVYIDFTK